MTTHEEEVSWVEVDRRSYDEFLAWIWGSHSIAFSGCVGRKALQVRTVACLMRYLSGGWRCESCRRELLGWGHEVEFHHIYSQKLRISAYRHCISRKFRQRALVKLWEELAYRVVMLCQSCHKMAHRSQAWSVEHGISALCFVCTHHLL